MRPKSVFRVALPALAVVLTACPAPVVPPDAGPPPQNSCDAQAVPEGCVELLPLGSTVTPDATHVATLPQPVASCFVVRKAGRYDHGYVNVVEGGSLYFVEDPAGDLDFRVKSLLVEKGGLLQAGSESCPFGSEGRRLLLGLYGDDPTLEGNKRMPADPGIHCETGKDRGELRCFPSTVMDHDAHYCDGADPTDPCASTTPPDAGDVFVNGTSGANFKLEHYGSLNFDPNPFGYKVLAVSYGGRVRLFGDRGTRGSAAVEGNGSCRVPTADESTLDAKELRAWAKLTGTSWVRLDGQQDEGDRSLLTLDRAVEDWRVGDEIVIGPTDWYPGHHETREILAVTTLATGQTQLAVAKLQYPHISKIFDLKDIEAQGGEFTDKPRRSAVDQRAPIGLLTRSITIRSLGKTADDAFPAPSACLEGSNRPDCYFGGHVLFRQGFGEVQVQGVEFKQLGQGGRMGHYPVHFHLGKSTKYTGGKAFVRDSSVWDSMTRFVVLHGTHQVDLSRNVGFLSTGHGYYLEDATEIENTLCHNLGVAARAPTTEFLTAQRELYDAKPAPKGEAPAAARFIPPILDGVNNNIGDRSAGPAFRAGSDGLMPVMFWLMNAWNEQVGNLASGVYGMGSCFWLLGSGRSGASIDHAFDGIAAFNGNGNQHAPLLRFRGNGCSTASLALPASIEMPPAAGQNVKLTAVKNPYLFKADGNAKSPADLTFNGKLQFERPLITGNFRPIQMPFAGETNCSGAQFVGDTVFDRNLGSCTMTYVDRFTTSYNWVEVNFGSIWFRPWFYIFANGAVTDQLTGGLTFVTAGSWIQVPPAFFSLAQDNLFVGTTQYPGSPIGSSIYAKRSGPILRVKPSEVLTSNYEPCNGGSACRFRDEGTAYWINSLNPKRLLNIYDGPAHAQGNTFLNIGAWECDPQPCAGLSDAACRARLPLVPDGSGDREFACGVYASMQQPTLLPTNTSTFTPDQYHRSFVIDAAIGWKQKNSFYYPPAFGHAAEIFLSKAPTLPTQNGALNGLNQCFKPGVGLVPGDCRHNAFDRTQTYMESVIYAPTSNPKILPPVGPDTVPSTSIDFQTVLIDIDGSLTGATGKLGSQGGFPTTSVSRNAFFDSPAQDDECLSYGVQTSPYTFTTTAMAKAVASPKAGPTSLQGDTGDWGLVPAVPIYRQWLSERDRKAGEPPCGNVCGGLDGGDNSKYGCPRASMMMGASIGQVSHLTMAIPRETRQAGALYYIDTNAQNQSLDCMSGKTGDMRPAVFAPSGTYVLYNLFPRPDSRTTYSLYVGEGVTSVAALNGVFVRVNPHEHLRDTRELQSHVTPECDPSADAGWCAQPGFVSLDAGVLTITLDHQVVADDFLVKNRNPVERCLPRDLCTFSNDRCVPCTPGTAGCRRLPITEADLAAVNRPDVTGTRPLDVACEWATRSSGSVTNAPGERVFVDCPEGGCLGFAFTLPSNFTPKPYAQVNPPTPPIVPPACFMSSEWDKNRLEATMTSGGMLKDPLCGAPRQPMTGDFCAMP